MSLTAIIKLGIWSVNNSGIIFQQLKNLCYGTGPVVYVTNTATYMLLHNYNSYLHVTFILLELVR